MYKGVLESCKRNSTNFLLLVRSCYFSFLQGGVCKQWRSRHWVWVWLYNERWEIKSDQIYQRDKINSFSTWNRHVHAQTFDMFREWVHVKVWVQEEFPSEFTIRNPGTEAQLLTLNSTYFINKTRSFSFSKHKRMF